MNETILVENPITREIVELPFPSIIIFGPEEKCAIMIITSRDPQKCAVWRGNLLEEPELRAELFENKKRSILHWDEKNNKPETIQ